MPIRFKARCVKTDLLEILVVGKVYECEELPMGRTHIVGEGIVLSSEMFREHFKTIER